MSAPSGLPNGVSVVLPNYNGRCLLEKNLPSIVVALNLVRIPSEIIVVDDCSTDDSISFVALHYPHIKIIESETNRGFSTTCNRGIAAAKYKYLCVCNTDVTFSENYLQLCIEKLGPEELFAVKGSIINYGRNKEDVINTESSTLMFFRRGFFKFKTREEIPGKPFKYEISKLGCCFVCRTTDLQKLGGFDEIYSPYYWEDCDLAVRALKNGLRLEFLPDAIVWHQLSSTINTYRSKSNRKVVSNRNKFIFAWRHMDTVSEWFSHTLYLGMSLVTRWLVFDWYYYVGLVYALGRFVKCAYRNQPPLILNP